MGKRLADMSTFLKDPEVDHLLEMTALHNKPHALAFWFEKSTIRQAQALLERNKRYQDVNLAQLSSPKIK